MRFIALVVCVLLLVAHADASAGSLKKGSGSFKFGGSGSGLSSGGFFGSSSGSGKLSPPNSGGGMGMKPPLGGGMGMKRSGRMDDFLAAQEFPKDVACGGKRYELDGAVGEGKYGIVYSIEGHPDLLVKMLKGGGDVEQQAAKTQKMAPDLHVCHTKKFLIVKRLAPLEGDLTPADCRDLFAQLESFSAVLMAHNDIHKGNVMRDRLSGKARLLDYGLASHVAAEDRDVAFARDVGRLIEMMAVNVPDCAAPPDHDGGGTSKAAVQRHFEVALERYTACLATKKKDTVVWQPLH